MKKENKYIFEKSYEQEQVVDVDSKNIFSGVNIDRRSLNLLILQCAFECSAWLILIAGIIENDSSSLV